MKTKEIRFGVERLASFKAQGQEIVQYNWSIGQEIEQETGGGRAIKK